MGQKKSFENRGLMLGTAQVQPRKRHGVSDTTRSLQRLDVSGCDNKLGKLGLHDQDNLSLLG
ncbi:hypothetical protein Mapa_006330 [Marchantia paleacea]|nr:hypothetical protein Mapa_006330 [Marchantia paleacea]